MKEQEQQRQERRRDRNIRNGVLFEVSRHTPLLYHRVGDRVGWLQTNFRPTGLYHVDELDRLSIPAGMRVTAEITGDSKYAKLDGFRIEVTTVSPINYVCILIGNEIFISGRYGMDPKRDAADFIYWVKPSYKFSNNQDYINISHDRRPLILPSSFKKISMVVGDPEHINYAVKFLD